MDDDYMAAGRIAINPKVLSVIHHLASITPRKFHVGDTIAANVASDDVYFITSKSNNFVGRVIATIHDFDPNRHTYKLWANSKYLFRIGDDILVVPISSGYNIESDDPRSTVEMYSLQSDYFDLV